MSCDSFKSCDACSASGSCHWCGDALNGGCYEEYNFLECVWSTPCEDLSKCFRNEPEFSGYASRAVYYRLGVALFIFWLCLFIPFYIYVARPLRLRGVTVPLNEDHSKSFLENDDLDESLLDQKRGDETEDVKINHEFKYKKSCASLFTGMSIFLAVIVLLTVYFSPSAPEFSVCTSKLDWSTIINTFTDFDYAVQGDYIFQASIYNPNRVTLNLAKCKGNFKYEGTSIGYFSLDRDAASSSSSAPLVNSKNISAPPGSIVDVLFVTKLDVPVSVGLEMARDYHYYGDLSIEVDTSVIAGVDFYGIVEKLVSFSLPPRIFHLSGIQVEYCKCKDLG